MDQAKRLKELEQENSKLKRLVANLSLDTLVLKDFASGKLLSPERRRITSAHCAAEAWDDGGQGMPAGQPAAWDAALSGNTARRRRCTHAGDHPACQLVRSLWVSPDHGVAENGYCESCNSKLRDKFLNGEIFSSMKELRVLAERWRVHHNTVRPHSNVLRGGTDVLAFHGASSAMQYLGRSFHRIRKHVKWFMNAAG